MLVAPVIVNAWVIDTFEMTSNSVTYNISLLFWLKKVNENHNRLGVAQLNVVGIFGFVVEVPLE